MYSDLKAYLVPKIFCLRRLQRHLGTKSVKHFVACYTVKMVCILTITVKVMK